MFTLVHSSNPTIIIEKFAIYGDEISITRTSEISEAMKFETFEEAKKTESLLEEFCGKMYVVKEVV